MQYDRVLDIATANRRTAKTWRNERVKWSDLAERLRKTTYTAETVAEYKAMGRDRQSEIKDVGGFVGGYCRNGRRTDVDHRSVLCLDADFADADLWDDWCACYGYAAALYSTHKHTTQRPRLRLIVPLARDVSPDEYQAIGRRIADTLGIDQFDDTTYSPQRLMYWPSTSKDGVFAAETLDAEMLDPDAILATYYDWTDVSSWPMSSRVAQLAHKRAQRQQDPLDKGGLIGAFCRAYSITAAIETFVPAYTPCAEEGRYTYALGSTAGGVVTYEDKYSYSHHATDPASGQLVNAWDLVRIHKYGELDEGLDPDTPTTKRPSYKAMSGMAAEDPRVKMELTAMRVAEAQTDYADDPETIETDNAWTAKLQYTDKGQLAQTIDNVVLVLRHDADVGGALAYNALTRAIVTTKTLPWRDVNGESEWSDSDDAALRYWLERTYHLSGKDRIFDAVQVVAHEREYHPIRQYLDGCVWDGTPRLDTLLIDYFGAEDTPYTRAVTRKTLTAAVARIFRPGVKFDYVLTLQGSQGIGKSTFFSRLAGDWFSDSFGRLDGKEAYEQLQGVWIMEIGELAGLKRSEVEAIKLYISKQTDRYRAAYGRRIQSYPRQCIFVGTTNELQFLRDTTGNRRWWVVDTPNAPAKDLWEDLTPDTVRQIWGEAVQAYKAGEALHLPKELEETARQIQAAYAEDNPQLGRVQAYLERLRPSGWDTMDVYERRQWLEGTAEGDERCDRISNVEIAVEALGCPVERVDRYVIKEISGLMMQIPGWRHCGNNRTPTPYGRQKYYMRVE